METAGIVAEFNPFHNGHAALIRSVRESGADRVVAVMSGNFVQRGSPAIADKRLRAKAALLSGVDLVLELPLVYAAAPARRFARGAVEILHATGVVDRLCFGSECGEAPPLRMLAALLESPAVTSGMRACLKEGRTFAKARELAVAEQSGPDAARLLASPNNVLAVEYLRAASELGWSPGLFTLRRAGAAHDSGSPAGEYASASWLRRQGGELSRLCPYVPEAAAALYREALSAGLYPGDGAALDTAVLARLRCLEPDTLAGLPDLSEGLENRLYGAIRSSRSLPELLETLKTKRYTMARVRRLVLAAFLGLTAEDAARPVPYLRVLGAGVEGKRLLSAMKPVSRLPVSHSLARLRALGGVCRRFADLEERSTDLFALTLPNPLPCGYEYTAGAVFL